MFDPSGSDRMTVRRAGVKLVALLGALGVDTGVVGLAFARQLMVEPVPEPRFVILCPPREPGTRPVPAEPLWPDIRALIQRPVPPRPVPPTTLPVRLTRAPRQVGDQPMRVSDRMEAPALIKGSAPQMPRLGRKAGLQGIVVLEVIIDQNGTVTDSRVLRDLGLGCGEAARAAVLDWKFRPARLDGRPISVYQIVTIRFDR
jgi:TonB family protein